MEKQTIRTAAATFAQAEAAADTAVKTIAAGLGTNPTYDAWEDVRKEWQLGYIEARKVDEEAARKAWSRFANRMGDAYGVEKPKAPSAGAQRATKARTDAAARVDTLVSQYKTVEAVRDAAAKLPKDASAQVIADHARALEKVAKTAEKSAKDAAKERIEAAKKSVQNAIKAMSAEQLESLAQAATLILAGKYTPKARKGAKAR